ncbi:peptidase M23 [Paenibacillus terrae HPL-003]|uniref:Peptidase M23 n=1 Tax=Paenibacillus terrae (strain HPL-003) TaxID=985665 RepID=G7W1N9_PAETH|nr:copper amine oxidase N-terminal domain-containing protein [Paenibacillus terrae]AET58043.1 peptidase M23 [Paenibacillus terrae HPL-003]
MNPIFYVYALCRITMLSSALLAVALFSTSSVVNAAQTDHSLNFSGTSLLKVNDYDVLYCAPVGPYTNEGNRLMAPLRSVSELLGAKVEYNMKSQEAVVNWGKNKIVFHKGKNMYDLNGQSVQMDTYPEVKQDSFIIPLGVLLRAMDIPFEYKNNKVVLQNESFNQSKVLQHVTELDWGRNNLLDNNSILDIQSFKLTSKINSTGELEGNLTVSALNRSGSAIKEGKEDLHEIFVFNQTISMDADQASIDIPDRKRPRIEIGSSVSRSISFVTIKDPLQYVLVAGRTIKTKDELK